MRIGPRRGLRVVQLGERDDLDTGLLDPVPAGDAEVEEAVGDVARDLLRPEDRDVDDAGIVDVGAVVDVGRAHDREVGVFEELERRFLERALRQHEAQHRLLRVAVAPAQAPATIRRYPTSMLVQRPEVAVARVPRARREVGAQALGAAGPHVGVEHAPDTRCPPARTGSM